MLDIPERQDIGLLTLEVIPVDDEEKKEIPDVWVTATSAINAFVLQGKYTWVKFEKLFQFLQRENQDMHSLQMAYFRFPPDADE